MNWTDNIRLTTTIPLSPMMTSAQVVETSVTTTYKSPFQEYTVLNDQTTPLSTLHRTFRNVISPDIWLTSKHMGSGPFVHTRTLQ